MSIVVGPSNYVEPYGSGVIPKPVPLHVDANGGLILGAGAVAALLGSVRIQDGAGAGLATISGLPDAAGAASLLWTAAFTAGFNGTAWDRLRTSPGAGFTGVTGLLATGMSFWDSGDLNFRTVKSALGDGSNYIEFPGFEYHLYNGGAPATGMDRARSASAANLGATSGLGAALASEPGEWAINNAAIVNVQATATRAAVAGTRHILKSILASFVAGVVAPGAANLTLVVRDGASGVGAILYTAYFALQAVAGAEAPPISLTGLHIVGTAGNAMTIEFTSAGGPNTFEAVSASGYDAS